MAEREGFEPSIRFWRILTFQASAFDHSATAPHALEGRPLVAATPQGKLASIFAASATSLAVTPPSLCVESRISTLFQTLVHSG
jgi:hypothetical protein